MLLVTPYPVDPAHGEVDAARFGGVEVAIGRIARGLARRGHDVTVLASGARDDAREEDGVRHVRVRRAGTLFGTPLAHGFRHLPPADVVHVTATYPGVSEVVVRAARRRGTPVVLDYHFDGRAAGPLGAAAASAYYAAASRALAGADLVLAKSASYAAASAFLRRLPQDRLAIVPNGVDPEAFPVGTGPREGVVCVGRLVPYKGVETLVRAAALLARRRDVPVRVAGDGPLRAPLARLAARLDAPVTLLGRVPARDLPAFYGSAAATALPSVNGQEAFGICLVESLASGTPVVASDLPGVRDVAGLGGVVVPPRDPHALARGIEAVLDRPPAPPVELARRAAEAYDWEHVLDRIEAAHASAAGAPA